MAVSTGKWYDSANLSEMHEDLAVDYPSTLRIVDARPGLKRHFAECVTCQQLKAEHENRAAVPLQARKRLKLTLRASDMHRLLRLPEGHEIVYMFATMDPNTISIVVAGENLPDAPETEETPSAGAELPRAA